MHWRLNNNLLGILVMLLLSTSTAIASNDDQPGNTIPKASSEGDCVISQAARDAIDNATEAAFGDGKVSTEALDLIDAAERVAGPPECDSNKAISLAGQALDIARMQTSRESTAVVDTEQRVSPAPGKPREISAVLGLNFGRVDFDDGTFSGDGNVAGFTVGASVDSRYEIGFKYSGSSPAEFLFDDMFYSEPSFDSGRELGTFEDAYLRSQLLYLRGDWPFGKTVSASLLLGYSRIELEIENASFDCGPLFPLVPLCLDEDGPDIETSYRSKESGVAWGAGLHWRRSSYTYISLEYVDQSVDDFDFSGIFLGLGLRD